MISTEDFDKFVASRRMLKVREEIVSGFNKVKMFGYLDLALKNINKLCYEEALQCVNHAIDIYPDYEDIYLLHNLKRDIKEYIVLMNNNE